jgi:hypothetical protein
LVQAERRLAWARAVAAQLSSTRRGGTKAAAAPRASPFGKLAKGAGRRLHRLGGGGGGGGGGRGGVALGSAAGMERARLGRGWDTAARCVAALGEEPPAPASAPAAQPRPPPMALVWRWAEQRARAELCLAAASQRAAVVEAVLGRYRDGARTPIILQQLLAPELAQLQVRATPSLFGFTQVIFIFSRPPSFFGPPLTPSALHIVCRGARRG